MTERVQELARLAGEDYEGYQGKGLYYEIFAKLIIKECAGIYEKIDNGNLHLGTDDYLEALRKHFGINQ